MDGPAFLYHFFVSMSSWSGGNYCEIVKSTRAFVERFRAAGVEPIFFFDGIYNEAKLGTQLTRRRDLAKDLAALVNRELQPQGHFARRPEFLNSSPPLFAKEILMRELRLCKVECYQDSGEADGLIASYYQSRKDSVLGVLSNDSDFLIANMPLLLLDKLRWEEVRGEYSIVVFDKTPAEVLEVGPQFLPWLSCLVGNDYTNVELCNNPQLLFALRAKGGVDGPEIQETRIRNAISFCQKYLATRPNVDPLTIIRNELCAKCARIEPLMKSFADAMQIFSDRRGATWPKHFPSSLMEAYDRCDLDNSILSLILRNEFWMRVTFSGEIDHNVVTAPIRRKIYGMLLSDDASGKVLEYVQTAGRYSRHAVVADVQKKGKLAELLEVPVAMRLDWCLKNVFDEPSLTWDSISSAGVSRSLCLSVVALRYLLRANMASSTPFLFVWEPLILLVHMWKLCDNVDLKDVITPEQEEASSRPWSSRTSDSRVVAVASTFQLTMLHGFFVLQLGLVASDFASGIAFDGKTFRSLYSSSFRHISSKRRNALMANPKERPPAHLDVAMAFLKKRVLKSESQSAVLDGLFKLLYDGFDESMSFLQVFPPGTGQQNKKAKPKKVHVAVKLPKNQRSNAYNWLRSQNNELQ